MPRCLRRCLSSPRRTRGPCTVTGQDEGARVQPPPRLGPCPPHSGPSTVARSTRAFQGPSLHLPVTLRGPRPSTFAPHSRALSGRGGVSPGPLPPPATGAAYDGQWAWEGASSAEYHDPEQSARRYFRTHIRKQAKGKWF